MNKVQAGRFKNKRVSVKKEWLRIHLGWKDCLLLTPRIISHIQVIDAVSSPNVLSGFWRGFFSRLIPSQTTLAVICVVRQTQYYLYRKNNISRRNCIDFNNQCTIPCCVDFKKHSHILENAALSAAFLLDRLLSHTLF